MKADSIELTEGKLVSTAQIINLRGVVLTPSATCDDDELMTSRSTNTTAAAVGVGARHLRQLPEDSRVLISRFLVGALVRRASRKARTQYADLSKKRTQYAKEDTAGYGSSSEGTPVLACGYIGGHSRCIRAWWKWP
jgi:hypothetical protein